MMNTDLQERFTRSCTDAAVNYTTATTAAYAAWAEQVFDFWAKVFEPPRPPEPEPQTFFGWPILSLPPQPSTRTRARSSVPALPMSPFGWPVPQWPSASPMQFPFQAPSANPYMAWFNMMPFAAPQVGAAWPMAFMMIASGMPQSVAWPTAKANVAAMDAADIATASVHKAFASYRSEGGHASARGHWPVANLMMLAVLIPLNINTVLSAVRVS